MKNLFAIVFVFSFFFLHAQTELEWCSSHPMNFFYLDGKAAPELMIDHNGNSIAVLAHSETSTADANIVKYNTDGELLWEHHIFNVLIYDLYIQQLLIDDDNNIYVVGCRITSIDIDYSAHFQGEPLIQKISPDGNLLWEYTNQYEIGTDGIHLCNAATLDEDGNLYVAGIHHEYLSSTKKNLLVFSLNTEGQLRWNHLIDDEEGEDILLKDDQLYVVGRGVNEVTGQWIKKLQIRTFSKEGELLEKVFNPDYDYQFSKEHPKFDQDGNFYIAKQFGIFNLQKFDINTNFVWEYEKPNFTSPYNNVINDYIIDQGSSVYLTGSYLMEGEEQNIVTTKLSPQGEIIWENFYYAPGQNMGSGESLAQFGDQKLVVSGSVYNGGGLEFAEEALFFFDENGQLYQHQLIQGAAASEISVYNNEIIHTLSFHYANDDLIDQVICKYPENYIVDTESLQSRPSSFHIFPNPAKNKITIQGIPLESIDQVQLFNAQGQLLLSNPDITDGILEIPSSIPNGIYFLNIKVENQILQQKIFLYK